VISNARQLQESLLLRAKLWRLLRDANENAEELILFRGQEDILQGLTHHWLSLLEKLKDHQTISASLPSEGHIFIEACVGNDAQALHRLLFYVGVDMEKSWEITGQENPWNAWLWLSSNVMNDGVVDRKHMQDAWEVLLPALLCAGFDLEKSCGFNYNKESSRREWLEMQDAEQLRNAILKADWMSLEQKTISVSFNSASHRL